MKEQSGTAGYVPPDEEYLESKTGAYYADMVNQDIVDGVERAKRAAWDVRKVFDGMSTIDREIVKRSAHFKALERLVEAVEAL
ncbi:hypothetical protein [Burkholderia pseudomallei]|uniref:hypothetical protein n=1 Tax=Burkholderia pseudomallei TaxID=28450 RepID=UPI00050EF513|nr:hypothetical protein [Burkholderia pseudomallei]KGD46047.1 hypothetical protein DP43_1278 [Burkholderia pseudomallei]